MKRIFFVVLVLILLASFSLAADTCDEFCQEEGSSFGECLDTIDEGFCEGDVEMTVYGFDYCSDFQRCCCGSGETSEGEVETEDETLEEIESSEGNETKEESSFNWDFDWGIDFSSDSTICTEEKSTPELIFWFLLVIVIILGLSNFLVSQKPKNDDEEINLE